MAKRENSFKKSLVRIMGTRWHVQSHEDKYSLGIPDISFGARGVNGWIELKQARESKTGIIKPQKFTAPQINWLGRRQRHGGNCFVMVKVFHPRSERVYIFSADQARTIAKGSNVLGYEKTSLRHWGGSVDPEELLDILTGDIT